MTNRPQQLNRCRRYTLLEVLAAVAVLVVMMGFLFQFTIGAQRIWTSTTVRTNMSGEADGIFAVLEEDLTNIFISGEIDADAGWFCDPLPKNNAPARLNNLCFFSMNRDGKIVAVNYGFDSGKLYRFCSTDDSSLNDAGVDNCWAKLGTNTPPDGVNSFINQANRNNLITSSDLSGDYIVAENLVDFKVQANCNPAEPYGNGGYEKPLFIKVSFTLQVPEADRNGESEESSAQTSNRTFTRVFFLP